MEIDLNECGAFEDLQLIKKVFDRYDVPFFLAYGTCLGAYRDKKFLPGDDDIDLGVVEKLSLEQKKQIGWTLDDLGFSPQPVNFNVFGYWEKTEPGYNGTEKTGIMVLEKNVHITIFFYEDDGKDMLCTPRLGAPPLICSPNKFYKTLDTINFKGEEFLVPCSTEEYLDWTYEDWKDTSKRDHGKLYFGIYPEKEELYSDTRGKQWAGISPDRGEQV